MLSINTCKKLNDAGLKWEPQYGDFYCWPTTQERWDILIFDANGYYCEPGEGITHTKRYGIWLPRLDQLLAEIYKQGCGLHLSKFGESNCFTIWEDECRFDKTDDTEHNFKADSPSEAAAQALLWILEQRRQA